jgi:hypothetical protein
VATEEPSALPEAADNQTQQEAPEEPPAVIGLPTVVTEDLAEAPGPTPTPRVIAQPTEIPPTPVPAAPTLPPSIPVTEVPVVALQPVEQAPPIATRAPAQDQDQAPVVSQPTPAPAANDDDPFNIFDEVDIPRIDPAQDPMERVREMQEDDDNDDGVNQVIVPSNGNGEDDNGRGGRDRENRDNDSVIDVSEIMPAIEVPTGGNRDNPAVASMPDVDAMIDEITASTVDRVTNPNTNPNVGDAGRQITSRDDDRKTPASGSSSRRKNDGNKNRTTQSRDKEDNRTATGIPRPGTNPDRDDDCSIGDPGFPFCN